MPLIDDQDRIAALEAAQQELKERVAYLEGRLWRPLGPPIPVPQGSASAMAQVQEMAKRNQRNRLEEAVQAGLIDPLTVSKLMQLWYPE